jgi:DNA-binding CsgD family transcriptional regulator
MEYMSALEASEKWGVSLRQVQRLLSEGRISRAKKYGKSWMIPLGTEKPGDPRRDKIHLTSLLSDELANIIAASTDPMPCDHPDEILEKGKERRLQLQYEAELAYLRGDYETTMSCFRETEGDDAARLRACPIAIAAAISLGDYKTYTEIESFLKKWVNPLEDRQVSIFAELALATAAVSVTAPEMAPEWLKEGDLSALPGPARPDALYLRAKYLHCAGNFEGMLSVAQTALTLSEPMHGFTLPDLYLRVTCAVACNRLGKKEAARRWLLDAMRRALPHGFYTPFAEIITAMDGLMEECLEQVFPGYYEAVIREWKRTWKNWITFHNQFTKDNITLMLTLREYQIALQAARRIPYAAIAEQHHISVGRLKNIMLGVYGKLLISGRDELYKYIL